MPSRPIEGGVTRASYGVMVPLQDFPNHESGIPFSNFPFDTTTLPWVLLIRTALACFLDFRLPRERIDESGLSKGALRIQCDRCLDSVIQARLLPASVAGPLPQRLVWRWAHGLGSHALKTAFLRILPRRETLKNIPSYKSRPRPRHNQSLGFADILQFRSPFALVVLVFLPC